MDDAPSSPASCVASSVTSGASISFAYTSRRRTACTPHVVIAASAARIVGAAGVAEQSSPASAPTALGPGRVRCADPCSGVGDAISHHLGGHGPPRRRAPVTVALCLRPHPLHHVAGWSSPRSGISWVSSYGANFRASADHCSWYWSRAFSGITTAYLGGNPATFAPIHPSRYARPDLVYHTTTACAQDDATSGGPLSAWVGGMTSVFSQASSLEFPIGA